MTFAFELAARPLLDRTARRPGPRRAPARADCGAEVAGAGAKTHLDVSYADKNTAKALGAR